MGHTYIQTTIKAKNFDDFKEKVSELKHQAAYEEGHSYSGSWNMLDNLEQWFGSVKDFHKTTEESAYGYCDILYYIQKSKRVFVVFGFARC